MKKRTKVLTAGLLFVSLLGFSSALSLVIKGGNGNATGAGVDQAVYLAWGNNVVGDITNLTPTNAGYATLVVKTPKKSLTAPGHDRITLTLAAGENKTLNGVSVLVSDTEWGVNTTADHTVTTDTTVTIDPTWGQEVSTISYYLKFVITEEAYQGYVASDNNNMGGTLTANYSWVTA